MLSALSSTLSLISLYFSFSSSMYDFFWDTVFSNFITLIKKNNLSFFKNLSHLFGVYSDCKGAKKYCSAHIDLRNRKDQHLRGLRIESVINFVSVKFYPVRMIAGTIEPRFQNMQYLSMICSHESKWKWFRTGMFTKTASRKVVSEKTHPENKLVERQPWLLYTFPEIVLAFEWAAHSRAQCWSVVLPFWSCVWTLLSISIGASLTLPLHQLTSVARASGVCKVSQALGNISPTL